MAESEGRLTMQASLWATARDPGPAHRPIDAALEIGAYEALWTERNATFKTIADKFREAPKARPSDFIPEDIAREVGRRVLAKLRERLAWFDVKVHGEAEYPTKLRDATHPIELLYLEGNWDLAYNRSVAVVGTRKPSPEALIRTRQIVRRLVEDGFTIVSGLAEGIDTAAHSEAIAISGQTVAVIGTPLGHVYPKANAALQRQIANEYLLISQVPVERYEAQNPRLNRLFFPERNKTMAAMTEATIIIEAGETSGTLVQAREALKQKRKLFILNNLFERDDLTWPHRLLNEGAIRVRDYAEMRRELDG